MGIFDKRINIKPLEYPQAYDFVDAINHSYWIFKEYNYDSDINDFHVNLTDIEKSVFTNALLAITQIEVSVKRFWANLYNQFPKPEFDALGSTFAECETRHSRAYGNLIELLGLNKEFETLIDKPVIQGRIEYLTKYLKYAGSNNKELYTLTLALFGLFIENCSLFPQFLIAKSFNKYKNFFKGVDNVIQATQREEILHSLAAANIINIIKQENKEWFNEEFYHTIELAAKKAYKAEIDVIEWIFEKGELDFFSKEIVLEFTKNRFNESLQMIGAKTIFDIDSEKLKEIEWFNVESNSEVHSDFFHKTPVAYTKKQQSINVEDLF